MESSNDSSCLSITALNVAISLAFGIISLIVLRFFYVVYQSNQPQRATAPLHPLATLIVMGSGGHTAEMLNLLSALQKNRFKPRYYVAAATDNMSLQKAQVFENSLIDEEGIEEVGNAQFMQIYRSREVGQSYITSIGTTLLAIAHALWLMLKIRPQVILCNGPGTCIPLCAMAFIFKVFGIRWSYIFYVESIARVQRLSLSAFLLYQLRMADQVFVQWPQLKRKYPRAHYVGRLITFVTVISTSPSKKDEAINRLGVDSFLVSTDQEQMQNAVGTLDFVLDTVSAFHPVMPLFGLLKPHGKLIVLGAPNKPLQVEILPLIMGRKMLGSSAVGGMKETQEMIDFAAKHSIFADVEVVPMNYVNKAMERLEKGDVRYRFVLDVGNTVSSA